MTEHTSWTDSWEEFFNLTCKISAGDDSRENVSEALNFLGDKLRMLGELVLEMKKK